MITGLEGIANQVAAMGLDGWVNLDEIGESLPS